MQLTEEVACGAATKALPEFLYFIIFFIICFIIFL